MIVKRLKKLGKLQQITNTSELKIGDWIYFEYGDCLYRGFITFIDGFISLSMTSIGFYKNNKWFNQLYSFNKLSTNSSSYKTFKDIDEFNLNNLEDKRHLIDLALMTGDKEWFGELTN